MKKQKSNKGITLIALIVTIIVLIILAVVAINAVQGDGIIAHAKNARDDYQTAQENENSTLAGYLDQLNNANGKGGNDGKTEGELKAYSAASKNGDGFLTENASYTDEESKIAVIPAGFKVSEVSTEQTIKTGLVVKDSSDNEFVWVPVPDISKMVKLKSGSTTNYEGILYDFTPTSATEMKDYGMETTTESGSGSNREPDSLSDYDEFLAKVGCNTIDEYENQMQTEFNTMVASVNKYKGFYVARYELSKNGNNLASKANADTIAKDWWHREYDDWYDLYNICKTYDTNSVQSGMIYGCQYDAMMIWMQNAGIDVTSNTLEGAAANPAGSVTGFEGDADILNNVYDLMGGLLEWTQESKYAYFKVCRGGSSLAGRGPCLRDWVGADGALRRWYGTTDHSDFAVGRPFLCLKS